MPRGLAIPLPSLLGSHPFTVLALSTSTRTLRPSIFIPSAFLYAAESFQVFRDTSCNFHFQEKVLSQKIFNCSFSKQRTKFCFQSHNEKGLRAVISNRVLLGKNSLLSQCMVVFILISVVHEPLKKVVHDVSLSYPFLAYLLSGI